MKLLAILKMKIRYDVNLKLRIMVITKINPQEIDDFDLFTGGFPCQAFSSAGLGLGELDIRGTLFYDIIRICKIKKPKHILLENVKGLTTKRQLLLKIKSELKRIGYSLDCHY